MNPKMELHAKKAMRLFYRIFGPTTVHLEHELCLWMTSMCLVVASLYSLYRSSFGSVGDLVYLQVTSCWLSRHFLHRLICTADVGTSLSKSPLQSLRWLWIIVTSGGQYFDVTTSVFASRHDRDYMAMDDITRRVSLSLLTNNNSSNSHNNNASGGGATKDDNKGSKKDGTSSFKYMDSYDRYKMKFNRKMNRWYQYVPPLQLLVFLFTSLFMIWFFYQYTKAQSSYAIPLRHTVNYPYPRNGDGIIGDNMHGHGHGNNHNINGQNLYHIKVNRELMNKKLEAKQEGYVSAAKEARDFVYSWIGMICMVMIWGTLGSLVVYGRIMPPLADLVAGAPFTVGRGSHKSIKQRSSQRPWSETYKSIATENKFHLHFKVLILRVMEYLILCAILPRSEFICKVTGHCDIETMWSETGNPTLPGAKGSSMYENLIYDRFQGVIITVTVVLSTVLLLISQIIILDRSHLAIKSFSHQAPPPKKSSSRKVGKNSSDASAFEFAGKYDYGNKRSRMSGVFATLSAYVDWIQKSGCELLANELGALSTSRILSICASIHVGYTVFVKVIWFYYVIKVGGQWFPFVLVYMALLLSAVEVGFLERSSLTNISDEIGRELIKNNPKKLG